LSSADGIRQGIYRSAWVRKIARVLDAIPHPLLACEIAPNYVAAARWSRGSYNLAAHSLVPLDAGVLRPSAVETNLIDPAAVRRAVQEAIAAVGGHGQPIALLVPDSVIRVFVLHFDVFPRTAAEAIPMLRWRLKKSVPFEAEETLISYMRQAPREDGVDVVTGLGRLRIIKEYESLVEPLHAGVIMSSTLATLPLLDDSGPMMLARVCGTSLTTAIAREGVLCGYRCTELPGTLDTLNPRSLLEEIFPVAAYYQDAWSEGLRAVQLSGFGNRIGEFQQAMQAELHCPVAGLVRTAVSSGLVTSDATPLAEKELDSLIGWNLNRGA